MDKKPLLNFVKSTSQLWWSMRSFMCSIARSYGIQCMRCFPSGSRDPLYISFLPSMISFSLPHFLSCSRIPREWAIFLSIAMITSFCFLPTQRKCFSILILRPWRQIASDGESSSDYCWCLAWAHRHVGAYNKKSSWPEAFVLELFYSCLARLWCNSTRMWANAVEIKIILLLWDIEWTERGNRLNKDNHRVNATRSTPIMFKCPPLQTIEEAW